MSNVTRDELKRQLKQKKLAPLYLLYGPEEFLREREEELVGV